MRDGPGWPATVTVQGPITNPGTVVVRTLVPDVVGQRLDIAKRQLELRRFEVAAGTYLEQGSSVRLTIER